MTTEQAITLKLNTGIDLSTATHQAIRYKSPSGDITMADATTEGQKVVINLSRGAITSVGRWVFQSYAVLSGEDYYGLPVNIDFVSTHGRIQ